MPNELNGHLDTKKLTALGVLVSLGKVLGDIGTFPLYIKKAIANARTLGRDAWI